ncbi:UNVERIFIED_CONTAM: hypothetical protein FKN15_034780 [Acipenser sinensis]
MDINLVALEAKQAPKKANGPKRPVKPAKPAKKTKKAVVFFEVGSWVGFTLMTQCLPVAFFTLVGFIQMMIWAKGKHRSYLKEFRDYPRLRSPILPFML